MAPLATTGETEAGPDKSCWPSSLPVYGLTATADWSATELEAELTAADRVAAPRRPSRRVLAFAGLGIAALTLAIGAMMSRGRSDPTGAEATRSIGVILFTNLSGERDNQYFSEGMTQEIADALGRIPGLRVAFHRPLENAPLLKPLDLARALGVQTLLQGAVQRSGNRIRVSAHLVNGNDGLQLWSGKFDRQASDVFELQDEVARAIASELKLTLAMGSGASFARVSTKDPEAHNLYLEGMYLLQRRGARNIYRSITLFERALERDPRFARAWAGIALADAIVITWDDVNADTMLARSVDAARRALAIDSTTSDAWTALGEATGARWQYDEAVPAFERAIELDPNNPTAHQWYAEILARLGRFDEARVHLATALQLAPLSPVVNTQVGRVELQARNLDKAETALRKVLQLDSTYRTAHTLLGAVHLQRRQYDRAIDEFRKSMLFGGTRGSLNLGFLGHAYALAGQTDSARVILRELEVRRAGGENVMHASLALIYDALGDRARALAQLDTAVAKYDAVIQMHGREAIFDPLRRDARGAVLLARAGDLRPGARQQP